MTDREAIQQLMSTYVFCLDARDYSGIKSCLHEDAIFEHSGSDRSYEGDAAIADLLKAVLDPLDATQHMLANFIIEIIDDCASLTCDIVAHHVRLDSGVPRRYTAGGKYAVRLKRGGGDWRIARLTARPIWSDGDARVVSPDS
ncbi:hypothetical protein BSL82_17380 [Tardibacter chloracetimidivorans]|uniref:SnoaL-like domain-containing protein n=1 Tax=Tardibacter chloracetimidivorans TaxID=1921510 RepID=A0A1L3ZYX5_9SPHN|nr:nuclear transport factor 2 family protein [Tardibacter chloracetimidivorans]API60834.1 hypothetical protein BSL82_17380 [Tardibacter chloracetimidivorans]